MLALVISPLTAYAAMPLHDVAAEHRVYIAGLGFDLILAWVLVRLGKHRLFIAVSVIAMFAVFAVYRSQVWTDSVTLWSDAEAKSPGLVRPHLNLGEAYQNSGDADRALEEYRHANALNPRLTPVYVNTGAIYLSRNQLELAETALRRAAELSPNIAEPHINLSIIAMRKKSAQEAFDHIEHAVSLNPNSYLVHFTRGDVLALLGRFDEAIREYEVAVNLRPDLQVLRDETAKRIARLRNSQSLNKSGIAP